MIGFQGATETLLSSRRINWSPRLAVVCWIPGYGHDETTMVSVGRSDCVGCSLEYHTVLFRSLSSQPYSAVSEFELKFPELSIKPFSSELSCNVDITSMFATVQVDVLSPSSISIWSPVHQNHVEPLALDLFERVPTRGSDHRPIAQLLKLSDGKRLVNRVVLHDEHERRFALVGLPTRIMVHVRETARKVW